MPESSLRGDILDRIESDAFDYEKDSHGCSRCVFKALQDNLNLKSTKNLSGQKNYVKRPQVVGKIARMTAEFILDYQTKKTKV